MYKIGKKIITIAVILILVASGLTVLLGQGSGNTTTDNNVPHSESSEEEPTGDDAVETPEPVMDKDSDLSKILTKPVMKKLEDPSGRATVRVASTDMGNLNRLLKEVGGTPHLSIGEVSSEDFDYSALDYDTGA